MAQELQGLLDRIQEEGLKKANEEKDRIIAAAKAEATQLLQNAEAQAGSIRKKAEDDAVSMEARAKAAISQAARDIILALKDDMKKRIVKIVKSNVGQAMTPEFMGQIILEMVKNYKGSDNAGLEILVAKGELDKMMQLCGGSLAGELHRNPSINIGQDLDAGLKISFSGEDVFMDFSDDALSSLICAYIGPRLASMLDNN